MQTQESVWMPEGVTETIDRSLVVPVTLDKLMESIKFHLQNAATDERNKDLRNLSLWFEPEGEILKNLFAAMGDTIQIELRAVKQS